MIGYLSGTVLEILEKTILIHTSGGVGYTVFPAVSLLAKAHKDQPLSCFVYTRVMETDISLYGFSTIEEKQVFEKLLSVSGIGPKIALQIISGPIDQFFSAVETGDDAFIAQTPGIGKKMAQKIIVELRGKLDLTKLGSGGGAEGRRDFIEAIEALEGLGYDKATVQLVLEKAPPELSAEELVKYFLQNS